jgi:hypothetical protein
LLDEERGGRQNVIIEGGIVELGVRPSKGNRGRGGYAERKRGLGERTRNGDRGNEGMEIRETEGVGDDDLKGGRGRGVLRRRTENML